MNTKNSDVFCKNFFVTILICSFILIKGYAQFELPVKQYTDSLKQIGNRIINGNHDIEKYQANEEFKKMLTFLLSHNDAISYDFSQVENLSVMSPSDNSFRLFTWTIPKRDGSFDFEGIVYSFHERQKKYLINELKDVRHLTEGIAIKVLKNNEWHGALYYQMIEVKVNGKMMYTLLGWDGNNALSTKKIIDVLTFQSNGSPVFGAGIFSGYGKFGRHSKRIIFEHASTTQMALKYEKQAYIVEKKSFRQTKRRKPQPRTNIQFSDGFRAQKAESRQIVKHKRRHAMMIVFDRLVPMYEGIEGMYQFYVPAINLVDGFIFMNNRWIYMPEIDARNPKTQTDKMPQNEIKDGAPVSQRKKNSKIPSMIVE
jgi:hypothetical protein